jgi:prepilin peptidase CpaA
MLMCVPVVGLMAVAAVIDWRQRRIPNWVTFSIILSGLVQSVTGHAATTPLDSVLGLLAGTGLTVLMYAIGALGGGDVKLLAGVGAWFGPQAVLVLFCVEAIIGAILALAQAAAQGKVRALCHNSATIAISLVHVRQVGVEHATATGHGCRSIARPLPYAVPVLIAMLILLALSWTPGR